MAAFKAYFKKEILESIRQYRFIIIGAVILFFAIADPVIIKLMPSIMKSQSNINMDITALMPKTTAQVIQNYIKDMFQIVNIVIVFTVSGTLSKEVSEQKLIFPYSKGCSSFGMVAAKLVHYILICSVMTFIGFSINYYYVNILFKNQNVGYLSLMKSAALMSLYFDLNISITVFFSSLFNKEFLIGILTLFLSYFSMIFSGVKSIYQYLPGYLVTAANSFGDMNVTKVIITSSVVILISAYLSGLKMKKVKIE